MNLSKIIPFLDDGGPKKLTKRNPPNSNLNDLIRLNYTESQGWKRNSYIRDTRAIVSVSRTCENILKAVAENTIGSKVTINFIKLEKSNTLEKQEREYIKNKWNKDIKNMVTGPEPNLFAFQKNIISELCITGEIYIICCRDENNKLILQPILSEHIDPTINAKNENGNNTINGIEYDPYNRIVAFWYRKLGSLTLSEAYRLESPYTIRLAFQGSYFYRGTPLLINNDYIRNIWLGRYNLAVKGYKSLSITGVLKSIIRDVIGDPSGKTTLGGNQLNKKSLESGSVQENVEIISVAQASILSGDTHQFISLRPNEEFDNFPASIIDGPSLDAKKYEDQNLAAEFGLTPTQLSGDHKGLSYAANRSASIQSHRWNVANTMPKIKQFMDEVFRYWVLSYKDNDNFKKLFREGEPISCDWIFPEPVDPDRLREAKGLETKIKIGLTNPTMILSERGEDPEMYKQAWIEDNSVYQFVPTQKVNNENQKGGDDGGS